VRESERSSAEVNGRSRIGRAGSPGSRAAGRGGGLVLLALLALLAAGCGGGAKAPSVASLGTTTTSSGSNAASTTLFPPGIGGFGGSMSTEVGTGAAGIKFTACMRTHGVPNFPDPDATGTLTITISPSLNPASPLFQRAEADCQHLLPPRKGLSQARQQQMKQTMLAFAACMRSHGFPHYPDPKFGPGGMVSQGIGRSEGIDPTSPIYQRAQKACQGNRAGGG
jgi:hypothetical protein